MKNARNVLHVISKIDTLNFQIYFLAPKVVKSALVRESPIQPTILLYIRHVTYSSKDIFRSQIIRYLSVHQVKKRKKRRMKSSYSWLSFSLLFDLTRMASFCSFIHVKFLGTLAAISNFLGCRRTLKFDPNRLDQP